MPTASFGQTINDLLSSFQDKARDGITWSEFLQLLHEFIAAAMGAAALLNQAGVDKKQLVLNALSLLYDRFAPLIVLPILWWLEFNRRAALFDRRLQASP